MLKKIGCLGPEGTFSDVAANCYANSQHQAGFEIIHFSTIHDVLQKMEQGVVDEIVVPVENSVEGSVNVTLDKLADSYNLSVIYEFTLPIVHDLIALPGAKKNIIQKLLSHPQIIGQCQEYIRAEFDNIKIEYEVSSAAAVEYVLKKQDKTIAAIGSYNNIIKNRAKNNLILLEARINDRKTNQTTFFVINNKVIEKTGDKVSIVFSINKDVPGGLHKVLQKFAVRDINLTKIESRPTKEYLGQYLFFIDLQCDYADKKALQTLQQVEASSSFFRILGVYKTLSVIKGEIDC